MLLHHILKLIHTRGNQKTLKPNHTRVKHRCQLSSILRHHSTPEPHIYKTIISRLVQLLFKTGKRCSRGNRVERHIDERGDAARSRSERRTTKAFPLSAARRVDVNVRIDKPRHHD